MKFAAVAVTFGRAHPTLGEEVAAAVILQNPVPTAELTRYCRERLAKFKVPQSFYVVEAIPRTATGKIQRRKVAEVLCGTGEGDSGGADDGTKAAP